MQKITKEQRNHLDDIVVDINSLTVKKIQLYIENGITIQELDQKSNNFYTFRGQFFGGLNYREAYSVLWCHYFNLRNNTKHIKEIQNEL